MVFTLITRFLHGIQQKPPGNVRAACLLWVILHLFFFPHVFEYIPGLTPQQSAERPDVVRRHGLALSELLHCGFRKYLFAPYSVRRISCRLQSVEHVKFVLHRHNIIPSFDVIRSPPERCRIPPTVGTAARYDRRRDTTLYLHYTTL